MELELVGRERGVGADGAVDGGDLAVRHAVYQFLVVRANRFDWNGRA